MARAPLHYLAGLTPARTALWCYLLWYLVVLVRYFDPSLRLWLTSLGLSAIIGLALLLNAGRPLGRWQTFRFFLMPFGVSSFAALVKGRGFVLVSAWCSLPRRPSRAAWSRSVASILDDSASKRVRIRHRPG
jgi:hypothetical protein